MSDYLFEELWGNRYFRLARYTRRLRFDICLMVQHFHITIGRYEFQIDW